MPAFTMIYRYDDGPAEALETECSGEAAAIACARAHLQAVIDESPTLKTASAGVGEGGLASEAPRWIGAWHWLPDDDWRWSREG